MGEVLKHPTFDSLALGAGLEMFNLAMVDVVKNIADPNTRATQARKIVMEVTLVPNEDRTRADVAVKATTKLAASKGASTVVYITRSIKGDLAAAEHNPAQMTIEPEMEPHSLTKVDR